MYRKILCYGDSNTFGYDPRSYLGGRYPESIRWTTLLEQQGWIVFNAGENGRSIPRHEWEIESVLQMIYQLEPDIVTIMLGSNDLLQSPSLSAEECASRMDHFLKCLLEKPLPCELLLIAPPPMTFGAWVNDSKTIKVSRDLPRYYQAAADRLGTHFVDSGAWDIDLTFDGVHFSEAGHLTFAKQIIKYLTTCFCPQ
jgi:lysophospholipase L1-like esterase